MKKIKYMCDEEILEYTLDNGLKVYLYNTDKTKNFYVTVSTHFGAEVLAYKKGNTSYNVTKGSAHFLEHRVMDFTKNKEAMDKINEFGSIVNAYTTYNGTNYNIFGSSNIIENMELLFDRVFKANIKASDVENERGIILEEYNMYFDDPYFLLHNNLNQNIFNTSFLKYPVLGTKEGIETVSTEELKRLYKDFYTPNNMFIVVTGSFNTEEIISYIKEYTKNIKSSNDKIKIIKQKETSDVETEYEEMSLSVTEPKIIIGYKIEIPANIDKIKYKMTLSMILNNEFGSTGDTFETLNKLGIKRFNYGTEEAEDHILIYFKASTNDGDIFMSTIETSMKNLKINETDLDRKKRGRISSLILSFEDIMQVEDNITTEIFEHNKLINNRSDIIKSITLKDANIVLKSIDTKNKSILKISCK